jgi:drug/metabolite transporter (DMT)-like permease
VWVGIFAVALHYACTYIGLSMTDSSKTALLKQAGALIYICFSFLFFKDEKFSIFKIVGAIIGFCGIMAINLSLDSISFSLGDILILCASICTVVSNIISRRSAQHISPLWITGISQLFGGLILFIVSLLLGGVLPQFTVAGSLVFAYICVASISAYTLWYHILKTNELSKLFIIKFAEPLFACVFGAILLGENIFRLQYLAAFVLISSGIIIGHHTRGFGRGCRWSKIL